MGRFLVDFFKGLFKGKNGYNLKYKIKFCGGD